MQCCQYVSDFSVIIPCFNDDQFLDRSIRSCLAQSLLPNQIVVVDDGSTDKTPEICASYSNELGERFIYHRQDNSGVSAARNTGVRLATANYIIFLDADDELLPDALGTYSNYLETNPQWLIGGSHWERNGKIKTRLPKLPASRQLRFREYVAKRLHIGNIANMCFAAELLQNIRFDTALPFGEDMALFAVLLTVTDPIVVGVPVAMAHRHDGSLRSRASFQDLVDSQVAEVIFEHPMLDAEYRRYADDYLAQNSRSLMKRAYRDQCYDDAVHWYEHLLKIKPANALDLKMLGRYLLARGKVSRSKNKPAED